MTGTPKLSNAQRAAKRRSKDTARGILQINVRVPAIWDVALKILAEHLRKGEKLDGFVIRDPANGRVRTITL